MKHLISILKIGLVSILLWLTNLSYGQDHILIHTVEEGQTLYSISKTYEVSPEELRAANPSIDESNTIKPGQVLRIKLKSADNIENVENISKKKVVHKVKEKETLFGISKAYAVNIDDVIAWNNIEDNRIKIGQELIVGWRYEKLRIKESDRLAKVEKSEEPKEESPIIVETPKAEQKPIPQASSAPVTRSLNKQEVLANRFNTENAGMDVKNKKGPAIWFNTDNRMMNSRYYGLFSDVAVGSVVKVKNLINNKVVYVKVIGSLPDTAENHGAMIKLTPAAKAVLNSAENKIRVEVSYVN